MIPVTIRTKTGQTHRMYYCHPVLIGQKGRLVGLTELESFKAGGKWVPIKYLPLYQRSAFRSAGLVGRSIQAFILSRKDWKFNMACGTLSPMKVARWYLEICTQCFGQGKLVQIVLDGRHGVAITGLKLGYYPAYNGKTHKLSFHDFTRCKYTWR